jgi:hypothetical protein
MIYVCSQEMESIPLKITKLSRRFFAATGLIGNRLAFSHLAIPGEEPTNLNHAVGFERAGNARINLDLDRGVANTEARPQFAGQAHQKFIAGMAPGQ